jgi:hypothetical protein
LKNANLCNNDHCIIFKMATRNSDAEKGVGYNGKTLSDGEREEIEHAAAHDAAVRGHSATDALVDWTLLQAMLTIV